MFFKTIRKNFSNFEKLFDNKILQSYKENGYAIIPKAFSSDFIEELKEEVGTIVKKADEKELKSIFDTEHGAMSGSDSYFMESSDKIRFFLEKNAYDSEGGLVHPLKDSINKIGHGNIFLNKGNNLKLNINIK
jgi:phytanoyl-CoA hydroxylase